ncbi:hypothetical protein [Paenibacillus senegalensis]|uniref:hypothetical protein n=1 Tax=Paenibacillus senegalensis TaxID=1465766 RepID=UPI000289149D|nr:hypothetical protein [Paenibacillus senegalensis]
MAGIHLHPHDITDEGSSTVLKLIAGMKDVHYIFPQVNTIFERNPYPVGVLPHNPVRSHVMGEGTLHVKLDGPQAGEKLHRLYWQVDSSITEGADPLLDLIKEAEGTGYEIIPWVNVLNGKFHDPKARNGVVDFEQRPVEHWLCPNGPDVVSMWTYYISQIADRYGRRQFMIDRIRFPDWAGKQVSPRNLFSCFCPNCTNGMVRNGIDLGQLKLTMSTAAKLLSTGQYAQAVQQLKASADFQSFIAYRQASVSEMVEKLVHSIRQINPSIELWLDLWPPSYAWLLGQDYSRLTKSASRLKHFPYHKLGGGADVQGLIHYFADTEEEREEAFQAFLDFFGMDYSISYKQFCEKGFPIEFVKVENEKVRKLSQPETVIYSGVQMWNLHPEEFMEAVQAARSSEADDLLYYCYGWADLSLLEAAGKIAEQQED